MEISQNIRRFERLAYGALALQLAVAPFSETASTYIARYGRVEFYLPLAIFSGIYVAMIWAVARRRVERLRYLVAFGFVGPLVNLPHIVHEFWRQPVLWGIVLVAGAMNVLACYFVFTGDAVPWFEEQSSEWIG
jgi:hypothetical protein